MIRNGRGPQITGSFSLPLSVMDLAMCLGACVSPCMLVCLGSCKGMLLMAASCCQTTRGTQRHALLSGIPWKLERSLASSLGFQKSSLFSFNFSFQEFYCDSPISFLKESLRKALEKRLLQLCDSCQVHWERHLD